jgi:hypothetical protein
MTFVSVEKPYNIKCILTMAPSESDVFETLCLKENRCGKFLTALAVIAIRQ